MSAGRDPRGAMPSAVARPRSFTYRVRRIHRWLGLFIGVQFVLWTVGGLYFSWTDLDAIHGDHLVHATPRLAGGASLVSPGVLVDAIRMTEPVDSLEGFELVNVLGQPVYRVTYFTRMRGEPRRRIRLGDATTGAPRPALTREEAVALAAASFALDVPIRSVRLLTADSVGRHHEYREQPLPAWAVTFDHGSGATAYVGAETGQVESIRHDQWRAFDFLWMLHTMDYQGRDDFNNWLLRAFSVLGLVTVMSGFVLFAATSRTVRARIGRRAPLAKSRRAA